MGLLLKAVETYDANADLVGVYQAGRDPLAPIGHILTNAGIEITLNAQGVFLSARRVEKSEPKILIPVTEDSSGRTSGLAAHPLCDQLKYISCTNEKAHTLYLQTLHAWMRSPHSHPFLQAVFSYAESGTILSDLTKAGILDSAEHYDEKLLVCWRVHGFVDEEPACWKNRNLFDAFVAYYCSRVSERGIGFCMIDGKTAPAAVQHPKGIIPVNGNAKLISANDTSGFTYRGRFSEEWQAASVGYAASQKAHSAIRWLASDQGVREFSGNRIFLCWSPQGTAIPKPMRRLRSAETEILWKPSDYQEQLKGTLLSFRRDRQFRGTDSAILVSFDAATTGRLSVTYYNELSLSTFLERMQTWDAHCCWYAGKYGIQAPNLFQIVESAYGTQRGQFLETDDRIQRQHLQRLLNCKVSGGVFPQDIVKILAERASMPLAYEEAVWRRILHAACSAIQKYRYDTKQGGDEMAWELDKRDRSFQYGRLLAVMDRAEQDYYYKTQESRQTNAIKFMSEFRQRPFYVYERVNRHLHQAYLNRIEPWQANRYERLTREIIGIIREFPEEGLNKPLSDLYLMGYDLQRNAFFARKETSNTDEEE